MGKQKFWTGLILGAVAGAAATLFDEDVRAYVKDASKKATKTTLVHLQNPAATITLVRQTVEDLNHKLNN